MDHSTPVRLRPGTHRPPRPRSQEDPETLLIFPTLLLTRSLFARVPLGPFQGRSGNRIFRAPCTPDLPQEVTVGRPKPKPKRVPEPVGNTPGSHQSLPGPSRVTQRLLGPLVLVRPTRPGVGRRRHGRPRPARTGEPDGFDEVVGHPGVVAPRRRTTPRPRRRTPVSVPFPTSTPSHDLSSHPFRDPWVRRHPNPRCVERGRGTSVRESSCPPGLSTGLGRRVDDTGVVVSRLGLVKT